MLLDIFNHIHVYFFKKNCSDIDSNLMSALSSSHLDITPEKIRSFLPLVNWDRLASMYLTGRSGAECEARYELGHNLIAIDFL